MKNSSHARSWRAWSLLFVLPQVLAALGCSTNADLAAPSPVRTSQNSCSLDSECGAGVCVRSGEGAPGECRATENRFTRGLFEVSFPANATDSAGVRFFLPDQAIPGQPGTFDLEAAGVVKISGRVRPELLGQVTEECLRAFEDPVTGEGYMRGPDGSIPVRVSLTPVERFLGLNTQTYSAKTMDTKAAPVGHEFALLVPKGEYDVYVQPYKSTTPGCVVPPVNLRRIFSGDTVLSVTLSPPEALALSVRYAPAGCEVSTCGSLDGWAVEVIDSESGRVLSNKVPLVDARSTLVGATRAYAVDLYISTSNVPAVPSGSELLRLAPPDGVEAPVLYMERSGIELFQKGQGVFDVPVQLSSAVTVQGLVEGVGVGGAATLETQASLTFVAKELLGFSSGMLAAFSRTVDTDAQGRFSAELLPGSYTVRAVPKPESGFAATELNWSVSDAPKMQTGKAIELEPKVTIQGEVLDLSGGGAVGMPVQVVPSPAMRQLTSLERLLGTEQVAPRGGTQTLDAAGQFALPTDPGKYDISIRPPESSRWAWLVRPRLDVMQPGLDLERMTLPLPVAFEGDVRAGAAGLVPGALVRAYLYLDAEGRYVDVPAKATSVVQVAESRADAVGHFNLLVPAQLN